MAVTTIEHGDRTFNVTPQGWYKLVSSKQKLTFPYSAVTSVSHDVQFARRSDNEKSSPGVKIPFLLKAGTYVGQQTGNRETRSFWLRRNGDKCITIQLRGERDYDYLCIEVDNPEAEVTRMQEMIDR